MNQLLSKQIESVCFELKVSAQLLLPRPVPHVLIPGVVVIVDDAGAPQQPLQESSSALVVEGSKGPLSARGRVL